MEQKDHIPSAPTSLVNVTDTAEDSNVPVTSSSPKHYSITVETDDVKSESITVENDEVETVTDIVDNANKERDLCSHASSNDDVGSKDKSDHRIDSSSNEKKNVNFADDQANNCHPKLIWRPKQVIGTITVETDDVKSESIIVETDDELETVTDIVDNANKERDLCSHASSNDDVGSKDNKSDHRIESSSNEKKNVSFADDQGFKLENVRQFTKSSLPKISKAAFADLNVPQSNFEEHVPKTGKNRSKSKRKTLIPLFPQSGANVWFMDRVRQEKVCLENVVINGTTVNGTIRVLNLNFQKRVEVTYTTNNWVTTTDLSADFVSTQSTDTSTDRFEFVIHPPLMTAGTILSLYIKYVVNGCDYWDNNYGNNYIFLCKKYPS